MIKFRESVAPCLWSESIKKLILFICPGFFLSINSINHYEWKLHACVWINTCIQQIKPNISVSGSLMSASQHGKVLSLPPGGSQRSNGITSSAVQVLQCQQSQPKAIWDHVWGMVSCADIDWGAILAGREMCGASLSHTLCGVTCVGTH